VMYLKNKIAMYKIIAFGLVSLSLGLLTSSCAKENQADASKQTRVEVKFACGIAEYEGQKVPATIVNNSGIDTPLTVIHWNPKNSFFGDKWTPQQRCEEVSKRFQTIHNRDGLKYITADDAKWVKDRKINVVCSVKEANARCEQDDLLLTLETKDDPNEVLKGLIAFRKAPTTNEGLTRGENSPQSFAEGKRVYYDFSGVLEEKQQKKASDKKSAF
jgi:Circadian oscillating protein COP23